MHLEIRNIGKQYNRHWLFKHVSFELQTGKSMAITGRNGSGKSTLMQIIYGLIQASEGDILLDQQKDYETHQYFSISSPYMDLPWEFTITEIYKLYAGLGKTSMPLNDFLEFSGFSQSQAHKPVKQFSSGMQQKFKNALCIGSGADIILLDEPLTNMDKQGEIWYKNCLDFIRPKICIIAGNNPAEYEWADRTLQLV
jgi:ABC-type multidrug transport system ATPase subunit